jgi:hypothetical protein
MIVMKSTFRLDIGLSFLLQGASSEPTCAARLWRGNRDPRAECADRSRRATRREIPSENEETAWLR